VAAAKIEHRVGVVLVGERHRLGEIGDARHVGEINLIAAAGAGGEIRDLGDAEPIGEDGR
jgi:hypothetical protein